MKEHLDQQLARMTRRSLLLGGAVALGGASIWEWIRTRSLDHEIPWPLRSGLRANEAVARFYFRDARLAPTFAPGSAESLPVNGTVGIDDDLAPEWRLTLAGLSLSLADIQALPKTIMTTEFKCIEGWSRVVTWGGARFRDFVARFYGRAVDPDQYVAMETPDGEYYVGLDMASAMHPQTLLCYEMNDKPLKPEHGGPLRLVIPVKYGVKNLKRIGRIDFSDSRPKDYWAERGYDWYAGF